MNPATETHRQCFLTVRVRPAAACGPALSLRLALAFLCLLSSDPHGKEHHGNTGVSCVLLWFFLLSLVVSVCSPRVYHSTSRNHCVCTGQDHRDQHGHCLQRHGQQDAAGNVGGVGIPKESITENTQAAFWMTVY